LRDTVGRIFRSVPISSQDRAKHCYIGNRRRIYNVEELKEGDLLSFSHMDQQILSYACFCVSKIATCCIDNYYYPVLHLRNVNEDSQETVFLELKNYLEQNTMEVYLQLSYSEVIKWLNSDILEAIEAGKSGASFKLSEDSCVVHGWVSDVEYTKTSGVIRYGLACGDVRGNDKKALKFDFSDSHVLSDSTGDHYFRIVIRGLEVDGEYHLGVRLAQSVIIEMYTTDANLT